MKIKDVFGYLSLAIDLIPGPTRVRAINNKSTVENIIYSSDDGIWPKDKLPSFMTPPYPKHTIKNIKVVFENEDNKQEYYAEILIANITKDEAHEYMLGMIRNCDSVLLEEKSWAMAKTKTDDIEWLVCGERFFKKPDTCTVKMSWSL